MYMRKTRNASMIRREFGVFVRYDFHSSLVAVEIRATEKDAD